MPPDQDGGGQGLAMLRLEARRYKREMQQLSMQRELHEQRKSTASFYSEDPSRIPDRWRSADTFATSPSTSGTTMFWNREGVGVAHFEKLAIVEEGTQTDTALNSEVQTETEKVQNDADVVLNVGESRTMSSAANHLPVLKSCSTHCDELRSRISQEVPCECLADAAVRVNADVVFTAKPKRAAEESHVPIPEWNSSRFFRPDEKETISHIFAIATNPTGSLNDGQKCTDSVQDSRTWLRNLAFPASQHDSACSPIYNLDDYGARFRSLRDIPEDTTLREMFSWQQDRVEPESWSSIPPTFPTQPQPKASCDGTKAINMASDFSTEISVSKRVRTELTGEGVMAARLATKIKHALEAINGKPDTCSTNLTLNFPCRSIQSASTRRLLHPSSIPTSDADVYFQNVMAALSADRCNSNELPESRTKGEMSPARAERRIGAARRANIKSCGDHHASHQPDGIKNSLEKGVYQSGSTHVREKQRLLSSVHKVQSVAETAKRLYTDRVDCANDELRASTDSGSPVKHRHGDRGGDICKFAMPTNGSCPSFEHTFESRRGVASTGNDDVCGRCHVCQPQENTAPSTCRDSCPWDVEQPPEEAHTDPLDKITIHLADDLPTNITLSNNDCTNRPGCQVEICTPYQSSVRQRECSPNTRGENTVKRGIAPSKDLCTSAMHRVDNHQQMKKPYSLCALDPGCDGPRCSCHMSTQQCRSPIRAKYIRPSPRNSYQMPTRSKRFRDDSRNSYQMLTRSKRSGASVFQPIKDTHNFQPMEGTNNCYLDPYCVGDRDSCHMPTYAKSSGPTSCGPGGSRLKRNNGTNLCNKDPFALCRCPVHCRRRTEPTNGKLEGNSCRGKVGITGKVYQKFLDCEIPGHSLLLERHGRNPGRPCRDRSKYTKGRVDENLKVRPLRESRRRKDLCKTQNAPAKYAQSGVVRNQSTMTATEIIQKDLASVGKKARQLSGRYTTRNASSLLNAYTQAIQRHEPPLDIVDRAAAAAGLAKDIELMIADQLGESNCKSNNLMSRKKPPIVQNESLGQSNLGVGIIPAVHAVKKLKPVSLLSVVKREYQRASSHKGSASGARLVGEDGSGYSGQMRKDLKEQALWKKQLGRKERARLQSQSLLFPRQKHDRHAGFFLKGGSPSDFKNLANAASELEKPRNFVSVQRSEEFPSFWDESMDSYTLGSKRLRNSSPARDHSNKLLRLNVGKAELRAGRVKQDQHSKTSSNKMSSAFGRCKPPLECSQAKISTKNKLFSRRKIRTPVWVERMSKARDAFTSLLRPMLMIQSRMEAQVKPTFCRSTLPPLGFVVTSPATPGLFGKNNPLGRAVQQSPSRIQMEKPITPVQYDINTGRKVFYSEREPGELLRTTAENQAVFPNSRKSMDAKNIRITRRPIIKTSTIPIALANSGRCHLRVKGWNADPLIKSDNPHKLTDIIRYNRNGGLNVQVRRRNADGKCKVRACTSLRQKNLRQVTFAGMLVQNSHNQSKPKGLRTSHNANFLHTTVAKKKLITSQPTRVNSALRECSNVSATKIPPMHRYRGGGGRWTFHEGFWTDFGQKVSQGDLPQSPMTHGSRSQFGSPTSDLENAEVIGNGALNKPVERAAAAAVLTSIDENKMDMTGETYTPDGNGISESADSFKSLGFLGSDGGGIIDLSGVVAMKGILCPSQRNADDKRAESCSELELTITPKMQIQVSKIASPNKEQQKQEPSYNEIPQAPLQFKDEVFPDNTENETLVSRFDCPLEFALVQIEAQADQQCPGSECITPQIILDTHGDKHEAKLKAIELERTLMDIALHTILRDDPVQGQKNFAARVEPKSLPINERVDMWADKEVEAVVHSHDMSQSPLSRAVKCFDRSMEHDYLPLVDKATEVDLMPHVDTEAELDIPSLLSKDQIYQNTNIELRVPNTQNLTSPTQETCTVKGTQAEQHAVDCQAPNWNTVGIQTPGTTISTPLQLSPPAAVPMLMPIFFQQYGASIVPTVFPTVRFEVPLRMTSSVCQSPASAINSSPSGGVNQGSQATEFRTERNFKETAVQVFNQVSKLPIKKGATPGKLSVLKEESDDSDWGVLKESSSPPTPSTPLSSPNHRTNLKKAMDLFPINSLSLDIPIARKDDLQPSTLEACQPMVTGIPPSNQTVTGTVIDQNILVNEPRPQAIGANVLRRGPSWAKVKEMEAATLALLRAAASTKTPSATNLSEYSCESSLEFHPWMSPGEVKTVQGSVGRRRRNKSGGRFLDNADDTRTTSFPEHLGTPAQSHTWSSFGSGRASVGEIHNAARSLVLLSEGEVTEPGLVSTLDEQGQIQIRYEFGHGQGSEPGECLLDADASSS